MNPEARWGGILVVAVFFEAFGKEVVGEISILGEAIDTFVNLKVDPAIVVFIGEVLFLGKFIGNISKAYVHIFIAVDIGVEVEVSDTKAV